MLPLGTSTQPLIKPSLTVSGTTVADKTFDGNINATAALANNLLTGVNGEILSLSAISTFIDANVGKDKEVAVTYALTGVAGSNASNYLLSNASEFLSADIVPIIDPNLFIQQAIVFSPATPTTDGTPFNPAPFGPTAAGGDASNTEAPQKYFEGKLTIENHSINDSQLLTKATFICRKFDNCDQ